VVKFKVTDAKPTSNPSPSPVPNPKPGPSPTPGPPPAPKPYPEAKGLTINPNWPESVQEIVRNMVSIPAGKFKIGSPVDEDNRSKYEGPQTEFQVASFYMSKFELTVAQFREFINETAYQTDADKDGGSYIWLDSKSTWEERSGINWMHDERGNKRTKDQYNHPVLHVSWNDAKAFITWLNAKTSLNFRLPSEAEWEYACRAGTTSPFYTGDCLPAGHSNYDGNNSYTNCPKQNYPYKTVPVNANGYQANPFGLYHMHGNVWELCEDDFHNSYTGLPKNGKAWVDSPRRSLRVLRGGSWREGARSCRSAGRSWDYPDFRSYYFGFRLSLSSP
jgi:formylglycine-generating enzyme required for sulfatase activity